MTFPKGIIPLSKVEERIQAGGQTDAMAQITPQTMRALERLWTEWKREGLNAEILETGGIPDLESLYLRFKKAGENSGEDQKT